MLIFRSDVTARPEGGGTFSYHGWKGLNVIESAYSGALAPTEI